MMIQKSAFYELKRAGYLQVSGEDRLDFLQRQTTNDIRLLRDSQALFSVLTSPSARIIDVLYLLQEIDLISLITLPGYAESTARFLKSRIFFMDKVSLSDASGEYSQIDIFGTQLDSALERLGVRKLPEVDEILPLEISGREIRLLHLQPAIGLGFRIIARSSDRQDVIDLLRDSGILQADEQEYRLFHIEAGIPCAGAELIEAYTPLETRLESAVSQSKGCYTGQEVIARQVTYDKITQRLSGVRLDSQTSPGRRLWAGEKLAGVITSSAQSPRYGIIALAMLKRPHNLPGTRLEAEDENGNRSPARVVDIPFTASDQQIAEFPG